MWNPKNPKNQKNPKNLLSTSLARIYLDYAAATPVAPEALEAMLAAQGLRGNPGSIHAEGVAAARSLQDSRERIARELGCKARELIFTSGGTEANNLAILGFAKSLERNSLRPDLKGSQGTTLGISQLHKTHWIVSSIEHPSVLEAFGEVERLGASVSFVDPDEKGIIRPDAVARLLRPETVFVSVGWANGEIGTVQSLSKIARVLREHEEKHSTAVVLHTDAGQAPLYIGAHVHSLGVDLLTLDSGKLYGPRGVGALYLSDRAHLAPILLGGKQERGLRAGTENVVLAAGFARAYEIVSAERSEESRRLSELQGYFTAEIAKRLPQTVINGTDPLPNIINISIPGINSEYLVLALDHAGIALSTKSACREGEEQRSHVVEALGGDEWRPKNTLRFSFGRDTTKEDLETVLEVLMRLI
jgi:cysteine desulfurase